MPGPAGPPQAAAAAVARASHPSRDWTGLRRALLLAALLLGASLAAAAAGVALTGSWIWSGSHAPDAAPSSPRGGYSITTDAGGFVAVSHRQGLRVRFAQGGLSLASGGLRASIRLRAAGAQGSLAALAPAAPRVRGARVTYEHPGVSEWYVNGPRGLEQGFTLWRAPSRAASTPLTLLLGVSGVRAALAPDAQSVTLSSSDTALRYGHLVVRDARGRALRSWLGLAAGAILIRLDARGARYPLQIDPLFQQAHKITAGAAEAPGGTFGRSVAVSADGSTALVGAPLDDEHAGSVWALARSGSSWTVQGELHGGEIAGETTDEPCEAPGEEEADGCGFGASLAVSADGSTALAGSPRATEACQGGEGGLCAGQGAAWVLTRSGTRWTSDPVPLTGGSEETDRAHLGRSVALSDDGRVALVGAPADRSHRGAAWVFLRTESGWVQAGEKLHPSDEQGEGFFGVSVALSGDGSAALIGAPGDNGYAGAVWLFLREGNTWSQAGTKLTANGEIGAAHFGRSVALSSSGEVGLAGGFGDAGGLGAAWALRRSGLTWTQQKLLGPGETGEGSFGYRVALSGDGSAALIGAPWDDGRAGAAWYFIHTGSSWVEDGGKITARGAEGRPAFGYAAALSGDGQAALIGGPFDNAKLGAVWPFGTHEASEERAQEVEERKKPPRRGGSGTGGETSSGTNTDPAGGVLGFGPTSGSSCTLALASRRAVVSTRGRLTVRLRVRGSGRCRGRLRVTVATRRARRRPRVRTIATGTFSLTPGTLRPVALKLNPTGRALLRGRRGRLNTSIALIRTSPLPVQARSASLRLTLRAPRRPAR